MLLDIEQKEKEVIVSYYNKEGEVSFKRYNIDKFQNWVVAKDNDRYKDQSIRNWDGRHIKKSISRSFNKFSLLYFMDALPQKDQDEIFEFNMPRTYFVDIETEIVDGFPKPEEAKSRILTFSIITPERKAIVLGLEDLSADQLKRLKMIRMPTLLGTIRTGNLVITNSSLSMICSTHSCISFYLSFL